MAKYNSPAVTQVKMLISSRLSFVLQGKLKYTTQEALANRIGMSVYMVRRLSKGQYVNISLDAMLLVAQRLNVKYKLSMEWSGKGHPIVSVELEDLYPGLKKPTDKLKQGVSAIGERMVELATSLGFGRANPTKI